MKKVLWLLLLVAMVFASPLNSMAANPASADQERTVQEFIGLFESGTLSEEVQLAILADVLPVLDEAVVFLRKSGGEKVPLLDALLADPERLSALEGLSDDVFFPGDMFYPGDMFAERGAPQPGDGLLYLESENGAGLFRELETIAADLEYFSQSEALPSDLAGPLDANAQRLQALGSRMQRQMYTIPHPEPRQTHLQSLHLQMPKAEYSIREPIIVQFRDLPGNDTDWISLAASESDSNRYLQWAYTRGAASGEAEFRGPRDPGTYEIRVYYDWRGTSSYEIQHVLQFTVVE